MTPLKIVDNRVDDNALVCDELARKTVEQRKQLEAQSIRWLQQKLGLTKTAAMAVFAD